MSAYSVVSKHHKMCMFNFRRDDQQTTLLHFGGMSSAYFQPRIHRSIDLGHLIDPPVQRIAPEHIDGMVYLKPLVG